MMSTAMQYYVPGAGFFVGDCMPFFHDGTFHLYYLLDEYHHAAREGLGGHQWAHASSRDLLTWEHHPLALPLTEAYEASICTGSVFFHDGLYYAFYATRLPNSHEYLSLATSRDGIHFEKETDSALITPPTGYAPVHFRDPFVFRHPEHDRFHMLVTAERASPRLLRRAGCLAHFTSSDLRHWSVEAPYLMPGYLDRPECPDLFYWNGWYYLFFSIDSTTRYRLARHPFGPWQRPRIDTLDGLMVHVLRSAPFAAGRRLAVGYLASLKAGDSSREKWPYAGNALFRELVQHADGTLGTRFPPEMVPSGGAPLPHRSLTPLTDGIRQEDGAIRVNTPTGFGAAALDGVPHNVHIRCQIEPQPGTGYYGLCLRGSGDYETGHEVRFFPYSEKVEVRNPQDPTYIEAEQHALYGVGGLDRPLTVEVVLYDDIVDICIDGRRCLANRFPSQEGSRLFLFCQMGEVTFRDLKAHPLL